MNLRIEDICFIISAAIMLFLLIRELVPDYVKQYWSYLKQNRKDHEGGKSRKWIWTFKR